MPQSLQTYRAPPHESNHFGCTRGYEGTVNYDRGAVGVRRQCLDRGPRDSTTIYLLGRHPRPFISHHKSRFFSPLLLLLLLSRLFGLFLLCSLYSSSGCYPLPTSSLASHCPACTLYRCSQQLYDFNAWWCTFWIEEKNLPTATCWQNHWLRRNRFLLERTESPKTSIFPPQP